MDVVLGQGEEVGERVKKKMQDCIGWTVRD